MVQSVVSESTYWSVCCTTAARLSPGAVVNALSGFMTYVPVPVTTCTSLLCSKCRSYIVPACGCVAAAPPILPITENQLPYSTTSHGKPQKETSVPSRCIDIVSLHARAWFATPNECMSS